MSKTTAPDPKVVPPPPPVRPSQPCILQDNQDGSITVTFTIETTIADRLRKRAHTMNLARYIWENILKRALIDHVY